MSYRATGRHGMGQAKFLPGQINFMTTTTGRIPSLQPLVEAGLPPMAALQAATIGPARFMGQGRA